MLQLLLDEVGEQVTQSRFSSQSLNAMAVVLTYEHGRIKCSVRGSANICMRGIQRAVHAFQASTIQPAEDSRTTMQACTCSYPYSEIDLSNKSDMIARIDAQFRKTRFEVLRVVRAQEGYHFSLVRRKRRRRCRI